MDKQQEQQNRQNQGGSGSAENIGKDREAQQHQLRDLSSEQKNDIANEIGSGPVPVSSLRETGQLSGRDDAAGGSGDQMENTATGESTDIL